MDRRSPAALFCLAGGALLGLRGVAGFAFLDSSFATPGEGWHHLIHLVSGTMLLLAFSGGDAAARAAAFLFGIGYTTLALAGIAGGDTAFGLIGADFADKAFHMIVGVASLAAALTSRDRAAPAAAA